MQRKHENTSRVSAAFLQLATPLVRRTHVAMPLLLEDRWDCGS